jgi:hypothetical protein
VALKKISAGLRAVRADQAHAFLEVAVAGQKFESRLDEGFWIEREIAEALAEAHLSWAQDQVIGVHGADRALGTWRGQA